MRTLLLLLTLALTTALHAQTVTGRWTTIDDNTGKPRSVVEITEQNGTLTGRIIDIHDKSKIDRVCEKCTDDRKDKRVLGMEIIRGMKKSGSEWSKGTIVDPENGKVYDCKIWLDPGSGAGETLKVRGYVAFFYRTQTWHRVK